MHMRRALLLFAIVLGLAAVTASLSRPQDERGAENPVAPPPAATTPTAAPGSSPVTDASAVTLTFDASAPGRQRLEAGRPGVVEVVVDTPGQVTIPSLGMTEDADPLTPARMDVLVIEPGRHPIEFTPVDDDESRGAGTLVVTAPEE